MRNVGDKYSWLVDRRDRSKWGVWRNPKNLINKGVEINGGSENDQNVIE